MEYMGAFIIQADNLAVAEEVFYRFSEFLQCEMEDDYPGLTDSGILLPYGYTEQMLDDANNLQDPLLNRAPLPDGFPTID